MPALNQTYNKICVTSKDSDQPVHPPSMARVLVYPSLDNREGSRRHTSSSKTLIRLRDFGLIVGFVVRWLIFILRWYLTGELEDSMRSRMNLKFGSCISVETLQAQNWFKHLQNICKDVQAMSQSQNTAFPGQRKNKWWTYNNKTNATYETIDAPTKKNCKRGTDMEWKV